MINNRIFLLTLIVLLVVGMFPVNSQISPVEEISSDGFIVEEVGILDDGEGMARHMEIVPGTNILAVADGSNGVLLVDITDPQNMIILSQFIDFANEGEFASDVDVVNNFRMIVYTNLGNFYSVNIEDPQNPVKEQGYSWWGGSDLLSIIKTQAPIDNTVFALEPDWNYDYAYTFNSYNFTSSSYSRTVYGGVGGQFPEATGLIIDNNFAYISDFTTLYKFDISSGGLELVATVDGLEFPAFEDIFSPTLFKVSNAETKYIVSSNGLVIDITAETPILVTQINFGITEIRDIIVSPSGEMVVMGTDYLATFDMNEFQELQRVQLGFIYYDVIFSELYYFSTDDGVYVLNLIEDNTAPSISQPADIYQNADDTTQDTISWLVSDANSMSYQIMVDGVTYQTGSVSGGAVSFNYLGIDAGYHTVVLIVTDAAENSAQDVVELTLFEENAPLFNYTSSYEFYNGISTNSLSWEVDDNTTMTYDLYINDTNFVMSGSVFPKESINFDISSFGVGDLMVALNISDMFGNFVWDNFTISIVEPVGPVVGYTGVYKINIEDPQPLTWEVTSQLDVRYSIYVDGIIQIVDQDLFGDSISYGFVPQTTGRFNVTVLVTDTNGESIGLSSFIDVIDGLPPSLAYESGNQFNVSLTGKTVEWSVSDFSPINFTLLINNEYALVGEPITTALIAYNIDHLDVGQYELILLVDDSFGNSNNDSQLIEIIADDISDNPDDTTQDSEDTETTPSTTPPVESTGSQTPPELELTLSPFWMFIPLFAAIAIRRKLK